MIIPDSRSWEWFARPNAHRQATIQIVMYGGYQPIFGHWERCTERLQFVGSHGLGTVLPVGYMLILLACCHSCCCCYFSFSSPFSRAPSRTENVSPPDSPRQLQYPQVHVLS